ncbi:hypothetical protein EOPP23_00775 [Endozoicomonas sp. OPT23]|uniref:thioredoxin domain-containing protein n=1 Tax=Endozoicomonas sp. OPT23 TaxID=2072845 RepID=UPI00129B95EC|nr:thioredoxin domain-containing protein [Endozoicomonas sp. OPT23]MRI31524.1 hypothetical protein [Endozoicomonas sp. OPT23]
MKKMMAAAALLLAMPLTVFGYSFSEGKNYTQLPETFQKSEKPTLTEVYSVYCDHCYKWEQKGMIQSIQNEMIKKKVDFEQAHIAFVANYGDKISKALLAAGKTGEKKAVKDTLFSALHEDKIGDWKSDDQFFATLAKAGLTREEFQKGVSSKDIQKKFKLWEAYEKAVTSTPSFVVNGKYVIKTESLESFEQFYALIDYLLVRP